MKILHTFWAGPGSQVSGTLLCMKAGWRSSEYHWMSWALSCLQAKALFGNIHLVTDDLGKEILIDKLKLPYNSVSTALQHELKDCHPDTWALAKLYTYGIQTEPFLHIDGDVILWKSPGHDFLNAPLFAQNLDKNLSLYAKTLDEINQHFSYIPKLFSKQSYLNKDIYAGNAGLIGGTNVAFFKEYSRQAFEFINKNKQYLDKLPAANLNFIFEQYLFHQLTVVQGISITYYKPMMDQHIFNEYIKFEDFPHVDMVHPVGNFKKYQHVCDHLAKKLRKDYPEYYYRIIDAVRSENKKMRSAIYYSPHLKIAELTVTNGADQSTGYQRTLTAINHLNETRTTRPIGLDDLNDKVILKNLLTDKTKRNCLLDVYRLEIKINVLTKKLYNNSDLTTKLYNDSIVNYNSTQHCFSLPENEMLKVQFVTSEHLSPIELGWIWEYDFKDEISKVVIENLERPKSSYMAILVPQVVQLNVRDAYLDELEMIVVSLANEPVSFANALKALAQYFPSEEIEYNYAAFKQLVFDTVKRLLYFDIVKIKIN